MTYKQVIRSLSAINRQFERDMRQRQRSLEIQRQHIARMQTFEQAALEVDLYENRIEVIQSIHKDCSKKWEWEVIRDTDPPEKPIKKNTNESIASRKLKNFKPNLFHKAFKLVESKKNKLQNNIKIAKKKDDLIFQEAMKRYNQKLSEWQERKDIATKIMDGDLQTYSSVLEEANPFSEIKELGGSIKFIFHTNMLIEAELMVKGQDAIPSEIKSLLKSGKLSIKSMPKSRFNELYQDYICSCVIRVARELFALLPLEVVIVHAMDNVLNTKTGYLEDQAILSVRIPRKTLEELNIEYIDPSDSMSNFIHNMKFKSISGFSVVDKLIADL